MSELRSLTPDILIICHRPLVLTCIQRLLQRFLTAQEFHFNLTAQSGTSPSCACGNFTRSFCVQTIMSALEFLCHRD